MNAELLPNNNRAFHIDSIRGFAILGILLMNIQNFGLPEVLIESPYGIYCKGNLNLYTYLFETIFVDSKMRTLFCILFGVGILLISERLNEINQTGFNFLNGITKHPSKAYSYKISPGHCKIKTSNKPMKRRMSILL